MTAIETIAEVLNRIPECRWDRFVTDDEVMEVYGWLERRSDGRSDFLLLRFQGIDDAALVSWTSSSAELSESIGERLFGGGADHNPCQRIADVFGPLVPGAIRL